MLPIQCLRNDWFRDIEALTEALIGKRATELNMTFHASCSGYGFGYTWCVVSLVTIIVVWYVVFVIYSPVKPPVIAASSRIVMSSGVDLNACRQLSCIRFVVETRVV